jgi:hypothetical protein
MNEEQKISLSRLVKAERVFGTFLHVTPLRLSARTTVKVFVRKMKASGRSWLGMGMRKTASVTVHLLNKLVYWDKV